MLISIGASAFETETCKFLGKNPNFTVSERQGDQTMLVQRNRF
jgi:hypothetical protein